MRTFRFRWQVQKKVRRSRRRNQEKNSTKDFTVTTLASSLPWDQVFLFYTLYLILVLRPFITLNILCWEKLWMRNSFIFEPSNFWLLFISSKFCLKTSSFFFSSSLSAPYTEHVKETSWHFEHFAWQLPEEEVIVHYQHFLVFFLSFFVTGNSFAKYSGIS